MAMDFGRGPHGQPGAPSIVDMTHDLLRSGRSPISVAHTLGILEQSVKIIHEQMIADSIMWAAHLEDQLFHGFPIYFPCLVWIGGCAEAAFHLFALRS
jgi:hypothetical protein